MDDIQKRVFAAFKKEHKKHLITMRGFLTDQEAGKVYDRSDVEAIKRCAHTLKGAARAVGLDSVQEAGLALESIFGSMEAGTGQSNRDTFDAIRRVLDDIEAHVEAVSKDPAGSPPGIQINLLDGCMESIAQKSGQVQAMKPPPEKKTQTPVDPPSSVESDIKKRVLQAFQNEYRTYLETIHRSVDTMTTDEPPTSENINTALRAAHTLKGAARAVDLVPVQEMAHAIETLFADIQTSRQPPKPSVVQDIVKYLNTIEDHVVSINPTEVSPIARLSTKSGQIPATINGGAPTVKKTRFLKEDGGTEKKNQKEAMETIRIGADHMDKLQQTAEQLMCEGLRQQQVTKRIKKLRNSFSDLAKTNAYYCTELNKTLDNMQDQAISQTILNYFQNQKILLPRLAKEIREVDRQHTSAFHMSNNLSRQIQTDVLKARMIPAEDVFQFLRKMMRDLAADEGKQVDFKISGLEVQADRLVLQQLKDPLMHMLRNAISHGIERPEVRASAGKNSTGTVQLAIEVAGNRLRITVEDDGTGLDFQKISDMALKKGHLSAENLKTTSHEELLKYIYQPGFTTVKMITDLHGRGIGMSVAQKAVNRLRGEINVKSKAQKGTRFVLLIPLTLSTHKLLLVRVHGQTYGIPMDNIERIAQIHPHKIHRVEGCPVINYHQQTLPFALLSTLLSIGETPPPAESDLIVMVILHSGDKMVALAVDTVLSQEETLVKDVPSPADQVPFFEGAFIRADGSVCLILNPAVLMETINRIKSTDGPFFSQDTVQKQKVRHNILIVDDSVTTRTLEKTILESRGYSVLMAVDGLDALEVLKTREIDLVVTDIQMPKMDGFALIEAMKKTEKLKEMPVIIVSSMADHHDMERGLTLGADAYIVKQKFDQKNLLEAIGQIL